MKILYHQEYQSYNFGKGHPFSPVRLAMLVDLLDALDRPLRPTAPAPADNASLLTVHSARYINIVESASMLVWTPEARRYGIDTPDVPVFADMDHAARWLVGGALDGAKSIISDAEPVLQLGGGLHHAMPERAAGFCIYNDLSVAINHLRQEGLRVAYVDIDVHHGDGVQWVHFTDPEVLTISLHESGQYLFPGTGMPNEMQHGQSVVNMPLEMHTDDAGFLEAFEAIVPKALDAFKPDVLVCQCGVDAHMLDPLADLNLTTHGFGKLFTLLMQLAEYHTDGRVLYTLGGGYHMDATVRSWALLVHKLMDWPLPVRLPEAWRRRWEAKGYALSGTLHDETTPGVQNRKEMQVKNQETLDEVLACLGRPVGD